jgi:hypothetical protein
MKIIIKKIFLEKFEKIFFGKNGRGWKNCYKDRKYVYDNPYEIFYFWFIVMGSVASGKSAIVLQLIQNVFTSGMYKCKKRWNRLFFQDYESTFQDDYRKLMTYKGQNILVDITDTSGNLKKYSLVLFLMKS